MGSIFLKKIIEFINNKRMDIFQSMFYNLFEKYKGDLDRFINEWFIEYSYHVLRSYFKEEVFKEEFEIFYKKRSSILKAYIKAYWAYCIEPARKPYAVEAAVAFFNLEDLDEQTLKRKYRELVKTFHPDIYPDKKLANEKLKEIHHYYQILKAYLTKFRREEKSYHG